MVATPIGNLRDITLRALDLLKAADLVLCEDTRVSARLLNHFGISKPLLACHDHNETRVWPRVLERLKAGAIVAQITDAGMPLVSDPGYRIVQAAIEAGIEVTALPGASAPITALALAGLPSDRFLFAGFPPPKTAARRKFLAEFAAVEATLLFFEAPHRLADSLADMAAVLGDRPAAVCRELTKRFEEIRRKPLSELAADYAAVERVRGEIVVVVGPPLPKAAPAADDVTALLADAMARLSLKEAAAEVAAVTGLPKREVYQRALELKGD